MRIVAGVLGGRIFDSPHAARTHPMSERVRGALFNTLGGLDGLTVLDPFAGSGALSFEAISRGAASAILIESDKSAQKTIAENIKKLGLQTQIHLVNATANAWLQTTQSLPEDGPPQDSFDVVICDPPYDNLQPKLLESLAACTKTGGVVVLSLPPSAAFSLSTNYKLLSTKSYGDAQLAFYRRIS